MCFGGQVGASVDLSGLRHARADVAFFNEGNTRWLVEVSKGAEAAFGSAMRGVPARKIGSTGGIRIIVRFKNRSIDVPLAEAEKAWRGGLWEVMG
jgi:phosphoribosylformylglycinamidine (FGAM) synthase-like enzyme